MAEIGLVAVARVALDVTGAALPAYRTRNRVERLVSRVKQCRRVATRYEKRAAQYLAMVTLAALRLWL